MKKPLLSLLIASSLVGSALAVEQTNLPPERPRLIIRDAPMPVLPARLRMIGVFDGEVRIAVSVDSTGKMIDHLIVAYTNLELAQACVRTLNDWTFEPPTYHGQPVSIQRELVFDFDSRGAVLNLDITSYVGANNAQIFGTRLIRPSSLKELDKIPTPLHTQHPLAPKGVTGDVVIEFFIDQTGAVRMPSIISADTPDLGEAAAATLRSWSFEPPTEHGRPVLVRARQTFHFKP